MTGLFAPCKKARPLAAPIVIVNLVAHGSDVFPEITSKNMIHLQREILSDTKESLPTKQGFHIFHSSIQNRHINYNAYF